MNNNDMNNNDMKNIKLSAERITDLLNFINNRIQLGVNGNLIGETKSITEIVRALESALINQDESIVKALNKSKCEEV